MASRSALFLLLLAAVVPSSSGCVTGSGTIYFEPSIQRAEVSIRRVAIVPNRLPLNLQNSEYWTNENWQMLNREFTSRGFEVVDFATSVSAFNRGALPVEDTRSSRDKYADLARALNVDCIVVPYYGTFGSATNFLFATTTSHMSVATLQFYLADRDDFFARADVSGKHSWTSGLFMLFGAGLSAGATGISDPSGSAAMLWSGVGIMGIGLITDLVVAVISDNSKWRSAFAASFREGLKPFFAAFPGPQGGRRGRAPAPAPGDDYGQKSSSRRAEAPDTSPADPSAFALEVTGPDANDDKRQRCAAAIRAAGGLIDPDARLRARLFLSGEGNQLHLMGADEETIEKKDLPPLPMAELCTSVFQNVRRAQDEQSSAAPATAARTPAAAVRTPAAAPARTRSVDDGESPRPARARSSSPKATVSPDEAGDSGPPPPPAPSAAPADNATPAPEPVPPSAPTPAPSTTRPVAAEAPSAVSEAPSAARLSVSATLVQRIGRLAAPPRISLAYSGSGATRDARASCETVVTATGALVDSKAPFKAAIALSSTGRRIKVSGPGGAKVDRPVRASTVEEACLAAVQEVVTMVEDGVGEPAAPRRKP